MRCGGRTKHGGGQHEDGNDFDLAQHGGGDGARALDHQVVHHVVGQRACAAGDQHAQERAVRVLRRILCQALSLHHGPLVAVSMRMAAVQADWVSGNSLGSMLHPASLHACCVRR